jgi:tetratricopeptide (TPR) repeat protein
MALGAHNAIAAPRAESRREVLDLAVRSAKSPSDFALRFKLAESRIHAGDRLEAVADLRAIIRLASPTSEWRTKAAKLLGTIFRAEAESHAAGGDDARAKRWAGAAAALAPGENPPPLPHPSARYRFLVARARAALAARAPSDALAALHDLTPPLSAEAYALRAEGWLQAGHKDRMEEDLRRALALDPNHAAVKQFQRAWSFARATELADRGEFTKALETLRGADDEQTADPVEAAPPLEAAQPPKGAQPRRTAVIALRARLRLLCGDTPGALADYESSADHPDAPASIHAALARLYVASGQEDRLYDRYGVAAEGTLPRDVTRLKQLAAKRLARGDTATASLCYRRIIELDSTDPAPWVAMAEVRAASGEFDKAVFNYREARKRGGPTAGDGSAAWDRRLSLPIAIALVKAGRSTEAGNEILHTARNTSTPVAELDALRREAQKAGLEAILPALDRVILERRGDRDALARLKADECESRGDLRGALAALSSLARRDTAIERRTLRIARGLGDDTAALAAFRALFAAKAALSPDERIAVARISLRSEEPQVAIDALSSLPPAQRDAARIRAEALLALGRTDAAIEALTAAGLSPDSSLALLQARRVLASGNAVEAIRLYQSAWGMTQGWAPRDFRDFARALEGASGGPAALDVLRRGAQRFPANLELRRDLALLLANRGATDEALQNLRLLLEKNPADLEALRVRIELLRKKGDTGALAAAVESLVAAGGGADRNLVILSAEGLAARGRNEDAIRAYNRAAKLAPLSAAEEGRLGDLFKTMGRDDLALDAWVRAARLEPSARLWARIARLQAARGAREESGKAYEAAVELDPRNAPLVFEWARMLLEDDDPVRAGVILERLPRGGPSGGATAVGGSVAGAGVAWEERARQVYRAVALIRSDRIDEVRNTTLDLTDSGTAAGGGPSTGGGIPLELRAEVAAAIGETSTAAALYSRAISAAAAREGGRASLKVHANYCRFLLSIGNAAAALTIAQRLGTLFPGRSEAWEMRALVAMRQGRLEDAVRNGRMALRIAPSDAGLRLTLAEALWRRGRFGEAVSVLGPAIRTLPDGRLKARALAAFGTAALSLGLTDRAAPALAAAHEMAVARALPKLASQIAFNLAIAERRRGEAGRTLSILEQNQLRGPEADLVRAAALVDMDRISDAIAILEGAAPNSPVASLNYGILLRANSMAADSVRVLQYLAEIWKGEALVHYHLGRSLEAAGTGRSARGEYLAAAEAERDPALAEVFRKEAARLLTAE